MGLLFQISALALCGVATATFTLGGYACNQPQLYQQCNCPSFCGSYQQYPSSCGGGGGGCDGGGYGSGYGQYDEYRNFVRKHRPSGRRHHKKKKFRFDTLEEIDSKELSAKEPEAFIEETTLRPVAKTTTKSTWDDEDLWESKFVGSKGSSRTSVDEELPEIDSAEVERVRQRYRGGSGGSAVSRPVAPASTGQGIGVNTGLGVGVPGLGGGGGGLFGISSGVGVGVPGVGPIGISSGLGIGK